MDEAAAASAPAKSATAAAIALALGCAFGAAADPSVVDVRAGALVWANGQLVLVHFPRAKKMQGGGVPSLEVFPCDPALGLGPSALLALPLDSLEFLGSPLGFLSPLVAPLVPVPFPLGLAGIALVSGFLGEVVGPLRKSSRILCAFVSYWDSLSANSTPSHKYSNVRKAGTSKYRSMTRRMRLCFFNDPYAH